jgi:hypothetical protein
MRGGSPSVGGQVRFFHRPRSHSVGINLFEPRVNFTREHADAMHGIVVLEKASLSHDEQVAIAADMVPMFFNLLKHLVGRSREHRARFNRAFDCGLLRAICADHVVCAARQLHFIATGT